MPAGTPLPTEHQPAPPGWLIELPGCPSTNTWALEHATALAHGACVWTRRQTQGRGRDGRRWHGPAGVLTASFMLDLAGAAGAISLAVALAVAHAVEDLVPDVRVQLKWPNDCYLDDRKLAGILCEQAPDGRMVAGIGLNVAPRWQDDPAAAALLRAAVPPIALADVCAQPPALTTLLIALHRYLIEACGLLRAGGWPVLLAQVRPRDWLAGRSVTVEALGDTVRGQAAGLADDGRLLVRGVSGALRAVASAHTIAAGP